MARSCGIHIDQGRFHLVALEGSAKKHRVVLRSTGEIPVGEDPVEAVARALRGLVRREKLRPESVGLAVDSGLAAFRSLTVPFDDREKTEEIIKFEIESDLPQWDIDDVIVDFLVLSSTPGVESRLLVTALPKERLERQLLACERGGLEAADAELDGTALFDAAFACDVFSEDTAQVLVNVGDSTTSVVVVDGGRLASIRAIRAGALPPRRMAFDAESAGEDVAGAPDPGSTDGAAESQEPEQAQRARLEGTVRRIRRELGRTIAGAQTEHPIDAVHFCGHAVAGLVDEEIMETPVRRLEALVLGAAAADAAPEDGAPSASDLSSDDGSELVVAYGAALRALGAGTLEPHLRREELRFTGKFERIELPLAIFALLLCTLLGVKLIVIQKRIDWRDTGDIALQQPGDMQLWMQFSNAYLFPDPKSGNPGRLKNPPKKIHDLAMAAEEGRLTDTKYKQLVRIKTELMLEINRLKKLVGVITDEKPPQSALQGSILVLGVLSELGDGAGRFGIKKMNASYRPTKGRQVDRVEVQLDMDFFGETDVVASENFARFKRAVEAKPWCLDFPDKSSQTFENGGGGVHYRGVLITVDVELAILAAEAAAQEEGR